MGIACSFKNTCCDNYHDDNSRGTGSLYFLRARSVTHVFGKGRRARQKSLVSFILAVFHFLSHRRSSEARATAAVTTAGVQPSLTKKSRNPFIASRKRASLTNGCHWRTPPPRLLPVPANVLTLSAGSVRILADKIYTKRKKKTTGKKIRRRCSTS